MLNILNKSITKYSILNILINYLIILLIVLLIIIKRLKTLKNFFDILRYIIKLFFFLSIRPFILYYKKRYSFIVIIYLI